MVAVGIWGAQLGAPAIWVLPITFSAGNGDRRCSRRAAHCSADAGGRDCAVGPGSGCGGFAGRLRLPFAVAAIVVAVFAVFHGPRARGPSFRNSANPLAYGVGFVTATGLLHLCGIMIGTLTRWPAGGRLIQGLGRGDRCARLLFPRAKPWCDRHDIRGWQRASIATATLIASAQAAERAHRRLAPSATFTPAPCIR